MKKLFFYLIVTAIIICVSILSMNQIRKKPVNDYRVLLKNHADKGAFHLSQATEFEWDKAVAFKFPVIKENLERAAETEVDFSYDLREGIIFIKNGEIVFKDIYDSNPEHPSDIIYELNEDHLSVYKKDTLICVVKKDDSFYLVKKSEN